MSTQTIQKQEVPAATWTVDPVHSSVRYEVGHSGVATFRGGFGEYTARLVTGDEPSLSGSVKVDSIDIDQPDLRGHLLSPDFFDAETRPEVRFTSRELRLGDDGSVELTGDLEIRGTTHEVSVGGRYAYIAAGPGDLERVGISLETAIDRREYGFDWQMDLPNGGRALEYEVKIQVELELTKAGE